MKSIRPLAILGLLLLLSPVVLLAQGQEDCPDDDPRMDDARYLRALSLDLRGNLPSAEELEAVRNDPSAIDGYLDEWLASEDFVTRAVRLHDTLLWPNITNVNLQNANNSLFLNGEAAYWVRNRGTVYRGDSVGCLDEPAQFIDGVIQTTEGPAGVWREGWVMVTPYHSGTPTRVCAFDAQEALYSPTGTRCDTRDGSGDPSCGCGPEMAWCRIGGSGSATNQGIQRAFADDVRMRVARVIRDDISYLDLFTSRTAFVNGPLVHYWKYQTEVYQGVRLKPVPVPVEQLPDLHYSQTDEWHEIQLGEEHAGILTSPLYLLRFQTGRARANRFFNAFMCQPFQPPANGIAADDEEAAYTQDLQQRDGCDYCHALLEPSAAYWGRWTESGAGYLSPEEFPTESEECLTCATTSALCSDDCSRYYVTSPLSTESDPYLGMLGSYEFRYEEHMDNPALGPKRLVTSAVADPAGRLPACVSRTAASYLLGRELDTEEEAWLDELSAGFVSSGYSYSSLIREIVTSPVYRSLR